MDCRIRNSARLLVGLERIGVVGLEAAFAAAEVLDSDDREALVDRMLEVLSADNYIPAAAIGEYRLALWREYLRAHGGDIRPFYSPIDVVVRDEPATAPAFVAALTEALGKHELRPSVTVETPQASARVPQLLIQGDLVIEGARDPRRLANAITRQISDW